jgi:hypothetical protein
MIPLKKGLGVERMTKIILSKDCGTSPKNIIIEKMTAASAREENHDA